MLGTRISCQITGFSVAAPSSACLSRCRRNACQFSPLDAVEVSLSQARICSRAGALNSKKRRPPVRFAESIHANWPVASIAQFRPTDKAQPIFGKIQDGTAFFTAELTQHYPLGRLALLQPPVCVHRGATLCAIFAHGASWQ